VLPGNKEEQKNKVVTGNKSCFVCLKTGHFSKACKSRIQCQLCEGRHYVVMCPNHPRHQYPDTKKEDGGQSGARDTNLSNQLSNAVLLQTLLVWMKNGDEERNVRALIDTGSQQSCITEKAASVLGLRESGEVKLSHCLFGGKETGQKIHKRYVIDVSSLNRKFSCQFEVLDQPKICGEIARVPREHWLKDLTEYGIEVSDVGSESREINLLIGADMAGQLFTGRIHPTAAGPVAVETKLGWTVMGRCPNLKARGDSSLLVTNLHIKKADVQDLWRLDVIGIKDPVETMTRDEAVESANGHFLKNVDVTTDGRYEVALPWLECHPPIPENKEIAVKRLHAASKKLEETGTRDAYQKVFDEW
jgi:hypothetical protein